MRKQIQSPLAPLPLYNIFSAVGWGYVLYNVISVFPKVQQPKFYYQTKNIVTMIQCCAVVEIFISLLEIVRSPLITTVSQVFSRLLVVIGVFQLLPETPLLRTYTYVVLLSAWSVAEFVRYLYYFYSLADRKGPSEVLVLLRYNLFWVLYPTGVACELLIIYSALPLAEERYGVFSKWVLLGGMLAYIPGFPVLFSHMVAQRRRGMKKMYQVFCKQN